MIISRKWLVLALCIGLPLSAQAHRAWLLPSATVLSGEGDLWVTVDAAEGDGRLDRTQFGRHCIIEKNGIAADGVMYFALSMQITHGLD